MNIHEIPQKIKSGRGIEAIVVILLIVLMSIISFCLGRLSVSPNEANTSYVKIITPESSLLK